MYNRAVEMNGEDLYVYTTGMYSVDANLSIYLGFESNITASIASNDTSTNPQFPEQLSSVYYIFHVLSIIITMATIFGNVLVIIAVISEKKLRKVGNVFIINLALSDCFVGVIVSPLSTAYSMTGGKWVLGETMCDVWVSLDVICCTASILNLCAIGYDRCNAIIHPIKYSRKRTWTRAWTIVTFVWLYSVLIAVPPFLGWRSPHKDVALKGRCEISREYGYTLYSTIGAFFLPLCVMLYFYHSIYKATCSRKNEWKQRPGSRHFVGDSDLKSDKNDDTKEKLCSCCWCFKISSEPEVSEVNETDTKSAKIDTSIVLPIENQPTINEPVGTPADDTDDTERRESLDPALLAIYQLRARSKRHLSNVTESSIGSMFYSSSESNLTATTSFSSGSNSYSISSGSYSRSQSTSTEGGRSCSILSSDTSRRCSNHSGRSSYSVRRSLRTPRGRHSVLKTEVIHELVAAHVEQLSEPVKCEAVQPLALLPLLPEKLCCDTDDGNDECDESDEPTQRNKTKRKLKSSTFRNRNSRKRKKIAMSQEKRAAKTLGIVMGCFVICWLPFFILELLRGICPSCYFSPILLQVLTWMGYFNSACNPVIYTFFNKDFKNAFKRMKCAKQAAIIYV